MSGNPHSRLEKNVFLLICFLVIVSSVGAIIEILPMFKKEISIEKVEIPRLYTPLELAGFLIYKREGCYSCHSQQIRKLYDEVERYGHYSLAAESIYDYPFMWGSKRTGPDLARVGEKYSDDWHVQHLVNPRSVVPESIMPAYPFLLNRELVVNNLEAQMKAMRSLGVPYSQEHLGFHQQDLEVQLGINIDPNAIKDFKARYGDNVAIRKFNATEPKVITEMDAVIAYLQGLGSKLDVTTNKGRQW